MPLNLNGMDPRVLRALKQIEADARARGIQTTELSGVRDLQDQKELYANYLAGQRGEALPYPARGAVPLAAAPGTSLHEKGLAFDLQATDPARQAELRALAPKYGLVTIGDNDPNHFQLASASLPARPGTPQSANPSNPIYEGLVARGYSPVQAYALMGNMQQESNFSPGALNEKEGAYGLLQWRQDRRANLENFARTQGKSAGDLDTQLDFIRYEQTKGSEAGSAAPFLAANDVGSANAALKSYIRYGDNSEGTRLTNAQAFASGKTATPGAGGASGGTSVASVPPGDWQSLLGAEAPPESNLGSMLSSAVDTAAPARMAAASPMSTVGSELPPVDLSYAPATESADELGARYLQNKQARQLSPLGQLFTLPTIGLPKPKQPAYMTGIG